MSTGNDEVKLFSFPLSPFVLRVVIALKEKNIAFETIAVELPDKPNELLEANPIWKKVPTLVHNGKSVAESMIILEYIEDAWPEKPPLLPEDAFAKSQMRFWADYSYKFIVQVISNFSAKPGSPERAAVGKAVAEGLKTLEAAMASFSAEGPFFTGKKLGYVDVVLAPLIVMLGVQGTLFELTWPGAAKLPRYHKWLDAMWAHPSVKDTLPKQEDAVEMTKAFSARISAFRAAAELKQLSVKDATTK